MDVGRFRTVLRQLSDEEITRIGPGPMSGAVAAAVSFVKAEGPSDIDTFRDHVDAAHGASDTWKAGMHNYASRFEKETEWTETISPKGSP